MLSDYFDMTLDELVKDVDVQEIRNRNLTDEKVASMYLNMENAKAAIRKTAKIFGIVFLVLAAFVLLGFIMHLIFPEIEWLWRTY